MSDRHKLIAVKLFHTAVWLFMNVVIFYLLYAVITDRIDRWAWIALAIIGLECLVLLVFKMACPLTLVARRYSASTKANFDIYLPEWLARNNKLIYGVLLSGILVGLGGGCGGEGTIADRGQSLFDRKSLRSAEHHACETTKVLLIAFRSTLESKPLVKPLCAVHRRLCPDHNRAGPDPKGPIQASLYQGFTNSSASRTLIHGQDAELPLVRSGQLPKGTCFV